MQGRKWGCRERWRLSHCCRAGEGAALSRSRPKPRPAPSSEPRLHLIRPPRGCSAAERARPRPRSSLSPLSFRAPVVSGARRGGCEGAEPLPGPAGWREAHPAHPPHTTFLPHTGFFFLTPVPARQVGELPVPPQSLQQPQATGFGTSRLRCRHQERPREAPGQLHGPKETSQRVGRLGETRANSQGMGLGFW